MQAAVAVSILLLVAGVGTTVADPKPAGSPVKAVPSTDPQAPPLTRTPSAAPFLVLDPPPPAVKSLRLEALRIAGERTAADWRYPEPEPIVGFRTDGSFFMGYPQYRPRTARSAALSGGAAASTLIGEILLGSGLPIAGVGAMVTGATLDAAAADVDRDAEGHRRR